MKDCKPNSKSTPLNSACNLSSFRQSINASENGSHLNLGVFWSLPTAFPGFAFDCLLWLLFFFFLAGRSSTSQTVELLGGELIDCIPVQSTGSSSSSEHIWFANLLKAFPLLKNKKYIFATLTRTDPVKILISKLCWSNVIIIKKFLCQGVYFSSGTLW